LSAVCSLNGTKVLALLVQTYLQGRRHVFVRFHSALRSSVITAHALRNEEPRLPSLHRVRACTFVPVKRVLFPSRRTRFAMRSPGCPLSIASPRAHGVFSLRQYLYFCSGKVKQVKCVPAAASACVWRLLSLRQYLYFCSSKASKVRTCGCLCVCLASSLSSSLLSLEARRSCVAVRAPPLRQYLYFCTSKASKEARRSCVAVRAASLRQYLYFCTSKASKEAQRSCVAVRAPSLRQYLYFCTSKASKLGPLSRGTCALSLWQACVCVRVCEHIYLLAGTKVLALLVHAYLCRAKLAGFLCRKHVCVCVCV
jgi:hypothetical protein